MNECIYISHRMSCMGEKVVANVEKITTLQSSVQHFRAFDVFKPLEKKKNRKAVHA